MLFVVDCHCLFVCVVQDEVKEALEQVCGLLPGDLGDECKSLVDTYIDPIWSLLQQEVVSRSLPSMMLPDLALSLAAYENRISFL